MREAMIEKSIELFEKNGFTSTSLQHIVDALGVTKGTFYYYFPSKEALLMEIHDRYIAELLARQQAAISEGKTYAEKIANVISLLIEDIPKQGAKGRIFFREIRHLEKLNGTKIRTQRDLFRQAIEQLIEDGIEAGAFRRDLRADMTAFALLGMTNYSYQWYQPDGEVTPEALAAHYVTLLLNGMEEK
jgi:TetR/AcrR family transcriptional regulator, cholesterol catabolism regulator